MTARLNALADKLDTIPSAAFATWTTPDGTPAAFPTYHPVEAEWREAVDSAGLLAPNPAYEDILAAKAPPPTVESIGGADLPTLKGYATYVVRGERFSDGHIGACHERGLLAAIVRRLANLDGST